MTEWFDIFGFEGFPNYFFAKKDPSILLYLLTNSFFKVLIFAYLPNTKELCGRIRILLPSLVKLIIMHSRLNIFKKYKFRKKSPTTKIISIDANIHSILLHIFGWTFFLSIFSPICNVKKKLKKTFFSFDETSLSSFKLFEAFFLCFWCFSKERLCTADIKKSNFSLYRSKTMD